jgi:hypothetical protein
MHYLPRQIAGIKMKLALFVSMNSVFLLGKLPWEKEKYFFFKYLVEGLQIFIISRNWKTVIL